MLRIDIPGWSIKAIAFGIAAVAIYTAAFGVIDEIYQRSITVGASVILVTLTVPLVRIYKSGGVPVRLLCPGDRRRADLLDGALALLVRLGL